MHSLRCLRRPLHVRCPCNGGRQARFPTGALLWLRTLRNHLSAGRNKNGSQIKDRALIGRIQCAFIRLQVGALCSCCSCCCHDLQIVKLTNRKDLMVRSEYVASTDPDTCIQCGDCVERCLFGARVLVDEQMKYDSTACLGCGLCVTVCPVQATTMEPRA